MGIRFFCPSCDDRMNVKSFLAGKRGICPKCEAKFDIPMASDPRAEQKKKKSGKLKLPTAAVASVANSTQDADDAADAANDIAGELFIPTLPAPQLAPQMESEVGAIPSNGDGAHDSTASHATTEDPSKVWYVSPRTGGEFGPADGSLMKRWLVEGRVASDSLVWREGWGDWKSAGLVFADLSTGSPPVTTESPSPSAPIKSRRRSNHAKEKKPTKNDTAKPIADVSQNNGKSRAAISAARGRGKWTAIVVALSILAVALLVVLIKILPTAL
ncbi:MAG TPA: DUF4339 domain-containing protein [Planctomycetes bacterium]|nr:DUF4339 domain-containing protein [Planctomycetota bacterium]